MKAKAEVAAGVVGDLDKSLAAARKEFAAKGFRGSQAAARFLAERRRRLSAHREATLASRLDMAMEGGSGQEAGEFADVDVLGNTSVRLMDSIERSPLPTRSAGKMSEIAWTDSTQRRSHYS
jgi:hypothetical protein